MHEPIRENLEAYLEQSPTVDHGLAEHLKQCPSCAGEMREMEDHVRMIRLLRATGEEPRAGFYGRVRDSIDERSRPAMWPSLLDSAFGRRLAIASATLALLMGAYLISTGPGSVPPPTSSAVVLQNDRPAPAASPAMQTDQDRDAVLVTLASYQE